MLPDRVSNPGPLTYESGALPIALRGPAYPSELQLNKANVVDTKASFFGFTFIYIGWFCRD